MLNATKEMFTTTAESEQALQVVKQLKLEATLAEKSLELTIQNYE